MDNATLRVEVVYALAERQLILEFQVPVGTSAREAVLRSGMDGHFPGLDLTGAALGVFGKALSKPEERLLEEGDRVEIYRPLLVDPKEIRKQRAARAALARVSDVDS
jgi:putative ubiquitin-RnfH superfamily antitoxin RatB of RatAB toxin-antitoxin module